MQHKLRNLKKMINLAKNAFLECRIMDALVRKVNHTTTNSTETALLMVLNDLLSYVDKDGAVCINLGSLALKCGVRHHWPKHPPWSPAARFPINQGKQRLLFPHPLDLRCSPMIVAWSHNLYLVQCMRSLQRLGFTTITLPTMRTHADLGPHGFPRPQPINVSLSPTSLHLPLNRGSGYSS